MNNLKKKAIIVIVLLGIQSPVAVEAADVLNDEGYMMVEEMSFSYNEDTTWEFSTITKYECDIENKRFTANEYYDNGEKTDYEHIYFYDDEWNLERETSLSYYDGKKWDKNIFMI